LVFSAGVRGVVLASIGVNTIGRASPQAVYKHGAELDAGDRRAIVADLERRRISCPCAGSQDAGSARVGYLDVVVTIGQAGCAGMRRAAVKVNFVFVTVDVEINAATGAVGGEDRAGERRIRSKHGGRDEYCCDCEERNRDAAGKL